ncbi:uncharacterized protein [Clytia hemisphaerica]|uniref:uncharacterized protein n=1 Tax=Clytia hemisphaerica TaxID=252671 RepID=UPI0034D7652D
MDQLLVAAGAKKKVFKWLNCFAVTNSYSTANRKHKQMAKNHDEKVLKWKKEIEDACKQIIQEKPGITKEELIAELKTRKVLEFQLVADNLDISQHSRHQDKENKNDSKHWFHTMAVLERVNSSQDLRTADYYKQMDVLPGPKTQKALFDDYTILFGRIIVKYLPAFDIFKKCFPKHIEHAFTKEMSKKSEVVSNT